MRRKRRYPGTWFPIIPTLFSEGEPGSWYDTVLGSFNSTAVEGDSLGPTALELVPDDTIQDTDTAGGTSLRDQVEGQAWVCKRVVGKVWGSIEQADSVDSIRRVILGVGLAVLPFHDDGTIALDPRDYTPLGATNVQAPWLWRRTWVMSNNLNPSSNYYFPQSTSGHGSVMDGGHVDTKGTVRKIVRDQRLVIVADAAVAQGRGAAGTPLSVGVNFGYDLRLFGVMVKQRNKSTFA